MIVPPCASRRRVPSRLQTGGGHTAAGFTLVELVLVLTLVGILAAVAGPRFFDRGSFDERAYYDELASALRYAQKHAVATGCPVRAAVTSGGYTLGTQAVSAGHCDSGDAGYATAVILPDGQAVSGTTPAGVTVVPDVDIFFLPAGGTALAGDQNVAVGTRTLTVVAASGLVLAP